MQPIYQITCSASPRKLKFSPDGSLVLVVVFRVDGFLESSHNRSEIIVFNVLQAKEIFRMQTEEWVLDASFLSDQQIVAAIKSVEPEETRKTVAIYDIGTRRMAAAVIAGDIRSVCVDQQRGRIFAGRLLGELMHDVLIYDMSLNQQGEFKVSNLYTPFDMAISHSGDRLAIAGIAIGIWNISAEPRFISEECPKRSDCTGPPCEVNSVDITPDGRFAVAGLYGAKGGCVLMDGESGNVIGWYAPGWNNLSMFYDTKAVGISPNGKHIAVAQQPDTTVKVYAVSANAISHEYDMQNCESIALSPTGNFLALGGPSFIRIWAFP